MTLTIIIHRAVVRLRCVNMLAVSCPPRGKCAAACLPLPPCSLLPPHLLRSIPLSLAQTLSSGAKSTTPCLTAQSPSRAGYSHPLEVQHQHRKHGRTVEVRVRLSVRFPATADWFPPVLSPNHESVPRRVLKEGDTTKTGASDVLYTSYSRLDSETARDAMAMSPGTSGMMNINGARPLAKTSPLFILPRGHRRLWWSGLSGRYWWCWWCWDWSHFQWPFYGPKNYHN